MANMNTYIWLELSPLVALLLLLLLISISVVVDHHDFTLPLPLPLSLPLSLPCHKWGANISASHTRTASKGFAWHGKLLCFGIVLLLLGLLTALCQPWVPRVHDSARFTDSLVSEVVHVLPTNVDLAAYRTFDGLSFGMADGLVEVFWHMTEQGQPALRYIMTTFSNVEEQGSPKSMNSLGSPRDALILLLGVFIVHAVRYAGVLEVAAGLKQRTIKLEVGFTSFRESINSRFTNLELRLGGFVQVLVHRLNHIAELRFQEWLKLEKHTRRSTYEFIRKDVLGMAEEVLHNALSKVENSIDRRTSTVLNDIYRQLNDVRRFALNLRLSKLEKLLTPRLDTIIDERLFSTVADTFARIVNRLGSLESQLPSLKYSNKLVGEQLTRIAPLIKSLQEQLSSLASGEDFLTECVGRLMNDMASLCERVGKLIIRVGRLEASDSYLRKQVDSLMGRVMTRGTSETDRHFEYELAVQINGRVSSKVERLLNERAAPVIQQLHDRIVELERQLSTNACRCHAPAEGAATSTRLVDASTQTREAQPTHSQTNQSVVEGPPNDCTTTTQEHVNEVGGSDPTSDQVQSTTKSAIETTPSTNMAQEPECPKTQGIPTPAQEAQPPVESQTTAQEQNHAPEVSMVSQVMATLPTVQEQESAPQPLCRIFPPASTRDYERSIEQMAMDPLEELMAAMTLANETNVRAKIKLEHLSDGSHDRQHDNDIQMGERIATYHVPQENVVTMTTEGTDIPATETDKEMSLAEDVILLPIGAQSNLEAEDGEIFHPTEVEASDDGLEAAMHQALDEMNIEEDVAAPVEDSETCTTEPSGDSPMGQGNGKSKGKGRIPVDSQPSCLNCKSTEVVEDHARRACANCGLQLGEDDQVHEQATQPDQPAVSETQRQPMQRVTRVPQNGATQARDLTNGRQGNIPEEACCTTAPMDWAVAASTRSAAEAAQKLPSATKSTEPLAPISTTPTRAMSAAKAQQLLAAATDSNEPMEYNSTRNMPPAEAPSSSKTTTTRPGTPAAEAQSKLPAATPDTPPSNSTDEARTRIPRKPPTGRRSTFQMLKAMPRQKF